MEDSSNQDTAAQARIKARTRRTIIASPMPASAWIAAVISARPF